MAGEKIQLVGCGALRREVAFLAEKNGWPIAAHFLDAALHADFNALAERLNSMLVRQVKRPVVVLYGACHPRMDDMVQHAGAFRIPCQNCIELILGNTLFTEELSKGAFFLLEDWARRWNEISMRTFGRNPVVVRDIFQGDRKYLLCLMTPCSENFSAEAAEAGHATGLPVHWLDVSLDHLEAVLAEAVKRWLEGEACRM